MKKVLVIDDDQSVLNYLNIFLLQTGKYEVTVLNDSSKAYDRISNGKFDLLLLDMDMPNITGLDILKYLNDNGIELETIVLTGVEDVELAVSAMKLGAYDYLTKPVENEYLLKTMEKAIERKEAKVTEGAEPELISRDELEFKHAFEDIISNSEKMMKIFRITEKIAVTDSSVLIWGESGTGKELIARAIHKISRRRYNKFIAVNAGVFANELFASEFFGHTKGAFTGADADKKGLIEEANEGTLFLDEIGELALPIQVKLLRVLQEGEFFRIGATQHKKVDVRIVAATNKDLQQEIKAGRFRKDLFYRLNMNSIYLSPLRERTGDIQILAHSFLNKFSEDNNKNISKISDIVLKMLNNYDYPGNVRELMNIINSAVIVESSSELKKKSLPQYFLDVASPGEGFASEIEKKSLQEVEKDHIAKMLAYTSGNRTQAAKILGISRVSLISKIKTYNLE